MRHGVLEVWADSLLDLREHGFIDEMGHVCGDVPLGIAEETDAIALVVSEETGRLSVAIKGELFYNLSIDDVRMMLINELKPKTSSEYDEEEIEEEEIYEEDN